MMKKIIIAISATCVLMLSLAGCGKSDDSGVVESTMPTIAVNSSSVSSNISKPAEKATSPTSKASSLKSSTVSKPTEETTSPTKATEEDDVDLKSLSGVIISSDSLLELETSDGNTYLFSMDFTADEDYTNIISNGNYVTVKYTGDIVGDDLGSAKDVILISENYDTDYGEESYDTIDGVDFD